MLLLLLTFILGLSLAILISIRFGKHLASQVLKESSSIADQLLKWVLPHPVQFHNTRPISQPPSTRYPFAEFHSLHAEVYFVARPAFSIAPSYIADPYIAAIVRDFFTALNANHLACLFRIMNEDEVVMNVEVAVDAAIFGSFVPNIITKNNVDQLVPAHISLNVQVQHILTGKDADAAFGLETYNENQYLDPHLQNYNVVQYLGKTSLHTVKNTVHYAQRYVDTHPIYNMFDIKNTKGQTILWPLTCQNFTMAMCAHAGFPLTDQQFHKYEFTFSFPHPFIVTKVEPTSMKAIQFVKDIKGKLKSPGNQSALVGQAMDVFGVLKHLPVMYVFAYDTADLSSWGLFHIVEQDPYIPAVKLFPNPSTNSHHKVNVNNEG